MKVLLYSQNQDLMKKSGIGRALYHQMRALELNDVEYTLDYKDNDYNIVHINTLFKKSYKVLKKAKKNNLKVIVHGHSTKEDFLNSFKCSNVIAPIFNRNIIRMYKNADCIITPTNYSKGLIENYKQVKCPVYAVSNGIDSKNYDVDKQFTDEEIKEFKEKFNITSDQKIVIGIGLFFVRKGLHDFIEVAKSMPDIKFIWFGQRYKGITSRPINKAIKHKPDNVILPGYVEPKFIKIAMKVADLFFFPSYEETEGIVVLESLATKLPVLIRDIKVFDDWLTDRKNCYKGHNNEEFIKLINEIINTDNKTIVENGYKVVLDRDIKIVGSKLKEVYKLVLGE